ncbi:MAG: threonine--tRNA ligase [Deltaproteobacteria bacterium]|nr:threonine--tRNA ligase [Deltaproteobacteria bacterium]
MGNVTVILNDNTTRGIAAGLPAVELLKDCSDVKNPVAVRIDNRLCDLHTAINHDARVEFVAADSADGLDVLRHSVSHLMAQAVKTLFPDVKVTIGPSIVDGFYYDFDAMEPFTPADLEKIEAKMHALVNQNLPIRRREMPRDEAIELFRSRGETYKVEIISELPASETVSLYEQGDFIDLCRGPHLPSTGKIKAFKLTGLAGAYWRGSEKNKMLQRIYGTAFPDKKSLQAHLQLIEEAKKRDHRKLGRELNLFNIYDEAGAGLIVYHPKGALLRRILEDFEVKQHLRRGYQLVKGPQILKLELWEKSGHLDNYRENMYFTEVEEKQYGLKPMNCLAHMLIYNSSRRSYKELPLRFFELGTVNRHEKSGVLHGLTRVREFTQDDAHILCTPEQLNQEILNIIEFITDVMGVFGFECAVELSTRPAKSIGTDVDWQRATEALESALKTCTLPYEVNAGDGAFYGPKIDFKLQDSLKRSWQCATIQCDFVLPERFDLSYIGADGEKHRPVMLHRVILGSIERFIGILIEHYAGAFPAWLAPVQAQIITISDEQQAWARDVHAQLIAQDIRADLDLRNESLNFKIREAQMQKIPYMLIIGNNEMLARGIAPRSRTGENLGCMPVDDFVGLLRQDCRSALQMLH